MANAPAPSYRFHVALLIESSSVPALRVVINGKIGTFFLQPKLDTENGDQVSAFYAAYSHADVEFNFPELSASRRKHDRAAGSRESSAVNPERGVAG